MLRAQEKLAEAEPVAREVLAGWRALEAGEKDCIPRNTLTSLNILTEVLHTQGKDKEAEPLCREAVAGFDKGVGPKHPYTLQSVDMLCAVLQKVGKSAEAMRLSKQYNLDEEMSGKGKGKGGAKGSGGGRGTAGGRGGASSPNGRGGGAGGTGVVELPLPGANPDADVD